MMRCEEFRLAAEDRPAGATTQSPLLAEHLGGCADCTRWNLGREAWGPLGELFQGSTEWADSAESAVSGSPMRAAEFADRMALRTRVRAAVAAEGRRPLPFWRRPAFGILAAAIMTSALVVGTSRLGNGIGFIGRFSPDRPALLGQAAGAGTAIQAPPARLGIDSGATPAAPGGGGDVAAASKPVRAATQVKARTSENIRIVRVGDDFGIEWAASDQMHKVIRSDTPRDFSRGEIMQVTGARWVDSSAAPASGAVYYYLID